MRGGGLYASALPQTTFGSTLWTSVRRKERACHSRAATLMRSCSSTLRKSGNGSGFGKRSASFAGRCASVSGWRGFSSVMSGPSSSCAVPIMRSPLNGYFGASGSKEFSINYIAIFEDMCCDIPMRRNLELEATIVEKYAAVETFLDERGRRIWAATESRAIGYGGDALVSDATGLSRPTIRAGRRELESGTVECGRVRRPGAGRPGIEQTQPGIKQALEKLVDPLTRGDPQSPLRWTCKSRAKLTAALSKAGWKVSSTTVSRLLHELGYTRQLQKISAGEFVQPNIRVVSGPTCRVA